MVSMPYAKSCTCIYAIYTYACLYTMRWYITYVQYAISYVWSLYHMLKVAQTYMQYMLMHVYTLWDIYSISY